MKIIHTAIVALILFASCQDSSGEQMMNTESADSAAESFGEETNAKQDLSPNKDEPNVTVSDRKLIKKGYISFESSNVNKTKRQINKLVSKYDGYIGNEQINKDYNEISHSLTVRIPSKHFDAFLEGIASVTKELEDKSISVEDVTEEFIDVKARIETKKVVEARYKELLERANSIEEILKVENQIGNLRAEIESMEGRLRYLKNRIGLSTLNIDYYQKIENNDSSPDSFGSKFTDALKKSWEGLGLFVIGVAHLWTIIALVLIGLIVYKIIRKRKVKD